MRTPDDRILTDAERLVEEIVGEVREAILDRAVRYAKGPTLTPGDIMEAANRLLIGGCWPEEIFDWLVR